MIEGDKRREGQKVVFERLVDLDINMNLMSDHNTIEAKNLYMSYSFIRSSLWQESLFVVGYLFVRLTGFRESLVLGKNLSVYFLELGNLIIVGDFNSHQLWVTLIIAEYQNGAMEVARNVVDSTLERPSLHEFPGLNNCQFIFRLSHSLSIYLGLNSDAHIPVDILLQQAQRNYMLCCFSRSLDYIGFFDSEEALIAVEELEEDSGEQCMYILFL